VGVGLPGELNKENCSSPPEQWRAFPLIYVFYKSFYRDEKFTIKTGKIELADHSGQILKG
jgi:hypothetical protein